MSFDFTELIFSFRVKFVIYFVEIIPRYQRDMI
jgi:hypothetical protein